MIKVTDALILMAGAGSRLGRAAQALPKPLIPIGGRPLISQAIDALAGVGVTRLHIVVGLNGESLAASIRPLLASSMELRAISNPNWRKQNGISVLSAANKVRAPFFLAMGDHLFDASILDALLREAEPRHLNLAIDRKIASIFDLEDAMKIQTVDDRVHAIGKNLSDYDAIDTGLFLCPDDLFKYLRRAQKEGDCSLADGVRLMAAERRVRAIDIGDAWWQDVDTPEMLARAQQELLPNEPALAVLSRPG